MLDYYKPPILWETLQSVSKISHVTSKKWGRWEEKWERKPLKAFWCGLYLLVVFKVSVRDHLPPENYLGISNALSIKSFVLACCNILLHMFHYWRILCESLHSNTQNLKAFNIQPTIYCYTVIYNIWDVQKCLIYWLYCKQGWQHP